MDRWVKVRVTMDSGAAGPVIPEITFPLVTFKSSSVVKPLVSMQKVVRAENVVVLDENNPHIRNFRDGTTIKLDSNNGVHKINMWVCTHETGSSFQLAGTVSGQELVRLAALCERERVEGRRLTDAEKTEFELESEEEKTRCQSKEEMKWMAKWSWPHQTGV